MGLCVLGALKRLWVARAVLLCGPVMKQAAYEASSGQHAPWGALLLWFPHSRQCGPLPTCLAPPTAGGLTASCPTVVHPCCRLLAQGAAGNGSCCGPARHCRDRGEPANLHPLVFPACLAHPLPANHQHRVLSPVRVMLGRPCCAAGCCCTMQGTQRLRCRPGCATATAVVGLPAATAPPLCTLLPLFLCCHAGHTAVAGGHHRGPDSVCAPAD